MELTRKNWKQYIENLAKADDKAAELITEYLDRHEIVSDAGFQAFTDYFYSVVTKYAEGASEMAAQAYEIQAAAQGAIIQSAIPAETPDYGEVVKAIRGTMLDSDQPKSLAQAAGRLVRRTGVDTTLNNALRDGAEWAWIPNGDTCAFCMTLASNGWQRASKKALRDGHAKHIHPNCDCTYAIRFDGKSTVEGYDPDAYRAIYNAAEGRTRREKVNSIRRDKYAKNKDTINAQKRAAYKARKGKDIVAIPMDDGTINMRREDNPAYLLQAESIEQFADRIQSDPALLSNFTPISFKKELENRGFEVRPLGRGNHKGVPFENGGGYITNYGGNGTIEYHPGKASRHGGRYYRLSDSEHGIRWFDTKGREIDVEATGKGGKQVLK